MSTRVYAQDRQEDGQEDRRTRFGRGAEWRQQRFVKSLESLHETIGEALTSVSEFGNDLSNDELDAVREQLERAKRRSERHADAFDDENSNRFIRRERNDRAKKT